MEGLVIAVKVNNPTADCCANIMIQHYNQCLTIQTKTQFMVFKFRVCVKSE